MELEKRMFQLRSLEDSKCNFQNQDCKIDSNHEKDEQNPPLNNAPFFQFQSIAISNLFL